jgi:CheY-like chemotaxis protein
MSDMDGIEATQCIYDACPTPVVMLTAYDTPELVERAGLAGAGAYLVKLPTAREIERAIIIAVARFDDMMELRRLNGELQARNQELQTRNGQLQSALNKVKLLSGLLPICANCKKVRDDEGYWQEVEVYIQDHSEAQFSHGICPDCVQILYPELQQELDERKQIVLTALTKLRWASLEDIVAATDLPKDETSTYLEIMVRDGQIRYVEVEGENFYSLADVR